MSNVCFPIVAPSVPNCAIEGKAQYGQNINLTCKSEEGSPPPTYKWESRDVQNMPRVQAPRTTDSKSRKIHLSYCYLHVKTWSICVLEKCAWSSITAPSYLIIADWFSSLFVFQRTASCLCTTSPKKLQDFTSAPLPTRSGPLNATSPSQSCHVSIHLISSPKQKIKTVQSIFYLNSNTSWSNLLAATMNLGSTGTIIGIVAGVIGLIAIIVIVYCCCKKKKKQDAEYAMG